MLRAAFGSVLLALWSATAFGAAVDSAEVKKRLADLGESKYDADEVVVLDDIDVLVRPTGIGETTTQRIVKILREGAIRGESIQRFDYDPTTNSLALKSLRVYRAGGAVEEVPVTGLAEQPAPQWGIFWRSRQVSIALPRLSVGDAVEVVWTKTGFNVAYLESEAADGSTVNGASGPATQPPMPGEWYDETSFWSGVPIVEKRYTVRIPRDKALQYAVYNGQVTTALHYEHGLAVYEFSKRDIPVFHGEGWMVSAGDVECKLVLATVESWEAKSKWFFENNEKSLVPDDAIKAKAAELTANCKSDAEKITVLNHWVAENVRYIGTSRGACEGYTVHDVKETFRDRGGVCKDKAAMLVGMLRAIGMESYVVMTEAGAEVFPVPADQFNHCVASVRQKDGSLRLLDPTWMPRSRDDWSKWAPLQHVVFGVPEGHALDRSPYFPPDDNVVTWRVDSELAADGNLRARWNLTATGGPETALRRSLHGRAPAERTRAFEEAFAKLGTQTRVVNAKALEPTDFSGPLTLDATIEADHYALGGARRIVPLAGLRQMFGETANNDIAFGMASTDTRRYPVKFRATRRVVIEETLKLPKGWTVEKLPEAQKLDGPAAALSFEIEKADGAVRYRCQVDLKSNKVQPVDYPNFKKVMDAWSKLSEASIICAGAPGATVQAGEGKKS